MALEAAGYLLRIDLDTGDTETLAEDFGIPQGLSFFQGNIFFSDWGGFVYRIEPTDPLPLVFPAESNQLLTSPIVPGTSGGLVVDELGNIYASHYSNGSVVKIDPSTLAVSDVLNLPGLTPRGLVINQYGNSLFVSMFESNEIMEVDLSTLAITTLTDNNSTCGLLNGPFGMVFGDVLIP